MILRPAGVDEGRYHPRCLLERIDFPRVLDLPSEDLLKFCLADLGVRRAKAILRALESRV